ncbi:MAG: hypothetical protein ACYTEX_25525 [Planctomycetota bacterium]
MMARRFLFLLLVSFGSFVFLAATRPAIGSVGNCSVTIYAGTNPVEEFSKAKLIQHPGGRVDVAVKLPNKTQFYILSNPVGFMPGWLAAIDANDDVTVQSPDGLEYIYPEDANYMLTEIKDANGDDIVTFDYNDNDGNLIDKQSDGSDPNLYIEYKYDASGLLEEIIARANDVNVSRTYTITYDANDRVEAVSGSGSCPACGGSAGVQYEYDANGLLVKVRDANDSNVIIHEYKYNDNDMVTDVYLGEEGDANHIRRYSYSSTGTDSYVTDTNEYVNATDYRVTQEFRDSTGFITKRIRYENLNEDTNDPSGASFIEHIVYTRDANSSVTKKEVIPPSAGLSAPPSPVAGVSRKEYTYDPKTGKVLTEKWYDANNISITISEYTYSYVLDQEGNILDVRIDSYKDARGGVTDYSYEGDDVEPRFKLMPEVNEGISGTQRLKYKYAYDGRKRVTIETQLDDSNNVLAQTRYQYDDWGNLVKRLDWDNSGVVESNEVTEYKYNGFNEMIESESPSGVIRGWSYYDTGRVKYEVVYDPCDPNYVYSKTQYYYDGNGRTKQIARAVFDGKFSVGNEPNSSWAWTEYEYDLRGNRTKVIEDVNDLELTTTYKYNNQGEVVQVTLPNGKWTKTYRDGRGLVTETEVGYGSTSVETTFEYDANGNLKWQTAPDGFKTRYTYDDYDRLISVVRGL